MTGSYPRFGLFNTEARILHSECVGEEYQIGIWFPFSYASSNQTYPVLYVTDGDYTFGLATGLIPTLIGTQEIPEVIVVGIGYNQISSYSEFGKLREQDMLPPDFMHAPPDSRTPQFMAFLRQELFPLIEANYRASPDDRTLYGFSVGGFFALYTMLTQPGLFRRYIAASCTWPAAEAYLRTCEQQYAVQSFQPPVTLYFSVGGLEEDQLPGFKAMVELLQKRDYPDLRLHAQIVEGEIHGAGVISYTFLNGLRTVFQYGSPM
jgi:predicted alpha/beta superfamily hydrolase